MQTMKARMAASHHEPDRPVCTTRPWSSGIFHVLRMWKLEVRTRVLTTHKIGAVELTQRQGRLTGHV